MAEAICTQCGDANPEGAKFCGTCGAALGAACPGCGAAVRPGQAFCNECGTRLTAAGPAPIEPPPPPASERRLVSVLFADLVGFTTLSESRDGEEVRELQTRYFDTCRRLIELYGGVVEKFIGDAVMAVWGAQSATEDDAERAVRAGLDLVAAVTALADEVGVEGLRARAGALTGEAIVSIGADGQGMVTGDLVNTASRVQSMAEPGTLLVGDSTRRATEPAIVYEDAGTHELKGKTGLYRLWRAVRVVSGARGALKSEGLEAPFVGRDRELRQIKDLFHACGEERRPHLVSVTGIAGIGKSRLVWEFDKYIDGIAQIMYWQRGRCLSYGEGVTYSALADMVRMRCRISEDDSSETARLKLAGVLDDHILDVQERGFVEPRVAHLMGLDEGANFQREDLFAAWRAFFERLADVYPTVLAFEDMQWADASLLDFVEYLLDWARQSPIFVITAARPELLEKRPTWGAGKRNFTSIYLEPLPEAAMRAMLAGLAPGLPSALCDQILARAEGVPLYAMETVRMLLDRGLLVRDESVYRPTGAIDTLEVPETLHALIAARLDGLSPQERRTLQDGAILGKTFSRRAVAGLAGVEEPELEPVLTGLVRKEVLSIQADPRSPEHGQYAFLQDLVRHVVYEQLTRRERHARHLAAAEQLVESAADPTDVIEVLASHYLAAFRSAPEGADVDALRRQALSALVAAGDHADALGAPSEAERYYLQAVELTDDPRQQADLTAKAGGAAWRRADRLQEAAETLGRAIELYRELGDTHAAARVTTLWSMVASRTGRAAEALDRLEDAYAAIVDDRPDADMSMLLVRLARERQFAGRLEGVSELLDRGLEIAEAEGVAEALVAGWECRAIIAIGRGRPQEALVVRRAALELALKENVLNWASNIAGNLSDLALHGDRYAEALEFLQQSDVVAERSGNASWAVYAHGERSYALYMLGRWDDALAEKSAMEVDELGQDWSPSSLLTGALELHLHRGETEQAQDLHRRFAEHAQDVDRQDRSILDGATACIRFHEGAYGDALAAARDAFSVQATLGVRAQAVKQGFVWGVEAALALGDQAAVQEFLAAVDAQPPGLRSRFVEAMARRFRARTAAEPEQARSEFASAVDALGRLEIPFWRAVCQLEQAEALAGGEEADALLAEAMETFTKLRARPWIERAEGARSLVGR